MSDKDWISPWPENRVVRTEAERRKIATTASSHLPNLSRVVGVSDADIRAMKAAFMTRFDERLPRTETLMAVAMIGYRMALQDIERAGGRSDD